ncbi:MAG TPA: hypothetical protein VNO14_02225 [Blastocatellia bacterium]|nr:hypothetical protein [Blastocatellia bacterium]
MARDPANPTEEEKARSAEAHSGYKPGCLVALLPGLVLLGLVFLGVLGGWALWIALPIVAIGLIFLTLYWLRERQKAL